MNLILTEEQRAKLQRESDAIEAQEIAEAGQRRKAWLERMKQREEEAQEATKRNAEAAQADTAFETNVIQVCKVGNHLLLVASHKVSGLPVSYIVRSSGGAGETYPIGITGAYAAFEMALQAFTARVKSGMIPV